MAKTPAKGYEDNRNALAALIKKAPENPLPIQEVRPVPVTKPEEELAKINGFWVPAELAKKVKVHAAESGKSIREISIEAYNLYLFNTNIDYVCLIIQDEKKPLFTLVSIY